MTTIIPALPSGMGSAKATSQQGAKGEQADFSELLESAGAKTGEGHRQTAIKLAANKSGESDKAAGNCEAVAEPALTSKGNLESEASAQHGNDQQPTEEAEADERATDDVSVTQNGAQANEPVITIQAGNSLLDSATTAAELSEVERPGVTKQPAAQLSLPHIARESSAQAETVLSQHVNKLVAADAKSTPISEQADAQSSALKKDMAAEQSELSDKANLIVAKEDEPLEKDLLAKGTITTKVDLQEKGSNVPAPVVESSSVKPPDTELHRSARVEENVQHSEARGSQTNVVTSENGHNSNRLASGKSEAVVRSGSTSAEMPLVASRSALQQQATEKLAGADSETATVTQVDSGKSEPAAPPKQDHTSAQKELQRQASSPDWLAQIEHGRRWQQSQQNSGTPSANKVNSPLVFNSETAESATFLAAKSSDEATGNVDEGADNGRRSEHSDEQLSVSVSATASGLEDTSNRENGMADPQSQLATAAVAGREAASFSPERAIQAQNDRPLNLHQAMPEQNARQLSQQVQVMINQELQEADIRLNPSELGGMRIQLKFEQGEISMHIQAQHAQAREMLEQAMPRLRDMLGQQGIQLGQGQVGSFAGQQGAPQNASSGQGETGRENGHNSSPSEQGRNDNEPGYNSYAHEMLARDGRIDFFA